MNLPDKEKISRKFDRLQHNSNSVEICNHTKDCTNYTCGQCTIESAINEYESQVKPQIEALESRLKHAEEENERLKADCIGCKYENDDSATIGRCSHCKRSCGDQYVHNKEALGGENGR